MSTRSIVLRRAVAAAGLATAMLLSTTAILPADAAPKKVKTYKNCTQLNKVFKHGVGKPGARDKTCNKRVTNFKRSTKLYKLNRKMDRDKDKIACEQR